MLYAFAFHNRKISCVPNSFSIGMNLLLYNCYLKFRILYLQLYALMFLIIFFFFRLREKKESVTVLLCGTSGCGKSTLSAILVYFSTEIVICSSFYLFCCRICKCLMKYKNYYCCSSIIASFIYIFTSG